MLKMPVVVSALLSILLDHFEGSLMSKAPKKDMANTTSMAKNIRLNTALVAMSFSLPAPKASVMAMPITK